MKSFGWIVMSLLAVFLVATTPSWAQPRPKCEGSGTPEKGRSVKDCVGELLAVQGDLIEAAAVLVTDMQVTGLFSVGREQFGLAAQGFDPEGDLLARIDSLRNQHKRAMAASATFTDDEYDEVLEQSDKGKGKQQCTLSDINFFDSLGGDDPPGLDLGMMPDKRFGDGKCNIFDAFDLDLMKNVKVNERKENMCERVCAEKEVGGVKQKGKSKERLTAGLLDGISAGSSATQSLTVLRADMAELGFLLSGLPLSGADFQLQPSGICVSGSTVPPALDTAQVLNIIIVSLEGARVVLNLASEIIKTVLDIAQSGCKQTVAGFNLSSVCTPIIIAFHISKGAGGLLGGAASVTKGIKSIITTGAAIDRSKKAGTLEKCTTAIKKDTDDLKVDTGILKGQVSQLQAAAMQTNAELAAIKAELTLVMSLLEVTRDLLLTPTGRREGFQP